MLVITSATKEAKKFTSTNGAKTTAHSTLFPSPPSLVPTAHKQKATNSPRGNRGAMAGCTPIISPLATFKYRRKLTRNAMVTVLARRATSSGVT